MKWSKTKSLYKEPLLHFLLIGAALFFFYGWGSNSARRPAGRAGPAAARITVSREAIERMNTQFTKTWQRPPTEAERQRLIEDFIRNEIFYREAIAIGLDRDDDVLKRRLRMKMEFIFEDISSWGEPRDEDLAAFMKKHRERYLIDPQISFHQVYINTSRRGKSAASDARQILMQLNRGADPDSLGDPTLLEAKMPLSLLGDIQKQFGDAFGKSLLEIEPAEWAGPVRSAFGLHLVFIEERRSRRLPDLTEIREAVKQDWLLEKQKELKDAAYVKVRERYDVIVEKPERVEASVASAGRTMTAR